MAGAKHFFFWRITNGLTDTEADFGFVAARVLGCNAKEKTSNGMPEAFR